jgi:hypothetical protein
MTQRYPLAWPHGWKRVPAHLRKRARFSKGERVYSSTPGGSSWMRQREISIADSINRVLTELQRLGVLDGDSIISTNLQVRLDGLPRSGQAQPNDPGVAVYWQRPGEGMKVMAIDIYDRVEHNIAAIAATLEAMRAIERHGGAMILERAFTGFDALPAPGGTVARGWRDVLGVNGATKLEDVKPAYLRLRSIHHPDKGGSAEMFNAVQIAYDQARQELGA